MKSTAATGRLFLFACLVGSGVGAVADTTVVRRTVSLKSDGKEITAIVLENTHARSFRDPSSGSQCSLTEKAEGVIWRVVCEGEGIPAAKVLLRDERGRPFQPTCWSSQGTINSVARTDFIAAGPDDSKAVLVTFGEATARIAVVSDGGPPPRSAADTSAPPVRPVRSRDQMLNLRVATDYQAVIVVPACVHALKKNDTATFACLVSEPREYIGQGKTWLLPSQNPPASAEVLFERVQVSVPDAQGKWDFRFSTPKESPWRTGLFDSAMRDGFHDAQHPGIDISGHSSGCSDNTGRFEVLELVSDEQVRSIQKFAANFEQVCSGRRLQGIIRYNSTIDR